MYLLICFFSWILKNLCIDRKRPASESLSYTLSYLIIKRMGSLLGNEHLPAGYNQFPQPEHQYT